MRHLNCQPMPSSRLVLHVMNPSTPAVACNDEGPRPNDLISTRAGGVGGMTMTRDWSSGPCATFFVTRQSSGMAHTIDSGEHYGCRTACDTEHNIYSPSRHLQEGQSFPLERDR